MFITVRDWQSFSQFISVSVSESVIYILIISSRLLLVSFLFIFAGFVVMLFLIVVGKSSTISKDQNVFLIVVTSDKLSGFRLFLVFLVFLV